MSFTLRPYQVKTIDETRLALRSHKAVLVRSPTGSGKTALSAYMMGVAQAKGNRAYFIVHRQELIEQSAKTFETVGIPYGIIAAGYTPRSDALVQIASIDTLKRRLDWTPTPQLCVWDETHHVAAAGWARTFKHFAQRGTRSVGLTATPARLDGRGLSDFYGAIVHGPEMSWLIEKGFLAPFKIFAPCAPDMSKVHTSYGEYVRSEMEKAMRATGITGNAVTTFAQRAPGKQGIVFCCSIDHSKYVAEAFRAAGIFAQHMDGEMERVDRKRLMADFRAKRIQVLTNVDLFGEGVDVPSVEVVSMLRPTQSLSLYLQQCGRAGRISPGKTHALILDHAGNVMKHGLPDEERAWTLEGEERGKKKVTSEDELHLRLCPVCFATHRPSPRCPECGHVYEVIGKQPEQLEGELVELDVETIKRKRKEQERSARSEAELITLGIMRGYRDPEGWARHMIRVRQEYKQRRFA